MSWAQIENVIECKTCVKLTEINFSAPTIMSKRFIFQQQVGDRKKAKLDLTVSDHNFPLSQKVGGSSNVVTETATWGDDNDDEILLLASQACEEAYSDVNISTLPDYSVIMPPPSTSTQLHQPISSTSKTSFSFKKPCTPSNIQHKVNDCNRISSPLPGISSKHKNNGVNISDDLILSDKICENQDPNYVYRQLLQLQEENAKLKSENGKLLEKCVTKEGEASILRSQLKNCQSAVDNARIEKIKAQEKAQMEWSDKLLAANNQLQDLRTQLDFKNLEIISVKEKCKMLENAKVKLTQVTLASNDMAASQKLNSSCLPHVCNVNKYKRVKTVSNAIQTERISHFLKLNTVLRLESTNLKEILPLIMEPSADECSLLDFNEKLGRPIDMSHNKCSMLNTLHQFPSTPRSKKRDQKAKISLPCIYDDIANIVACSKESKLENYIRVIKMAKDALTDVEVELNTISQMMTSAFLKEMDERYIEATNSLNVVNRKNLLSSKSIIKDEQAVLARRILTILVYILEDSRNSDTFRQLTEDKSPIKDVLHGISNICVLLNTTCCALLYSALLSSMLYLFDLIPTEMEIIKNIVLSRPMLFVSCQILHALTRADDVTKLCVKGGNLKVDYDQGVLLYKNDSCTLQVLFKQVEAALKCAERQNLAEANIAITSDVLLLYNDAKSVADDDNECECQLMLLQVLVHGLQVCSNYLIPDSGVGGAVVSAARRVCVGGAGALVGRSCRLSRLRYHRGLLLRLADAPPLGSMLSEILSTFQVASEDTPPNYNSQAWLKSFQTFSITD